MKNIKKLAAFKGWTLKEFATIIGVSQATMSNWTQDNFLPKPENIKKMCQELGCEPNDLID